MKKSDNGPDGSTNTSPSRTLGAGRPFSPGVSGNPGGRPKAVKELLERARRSVPAAFDLAEKLIADDDADDRVRLDAAKFLASYGLGAPPKSVPDEPSDPAADPLSRLSNEEVAELASKKLSTEH